MISGNGPAKQLVDRPLGRRRDADRAGERARRAHDEADAAREQRAAVVVVVACAQAVTGSDACVLMSTCGGRLRVVAIASPTARTDSSPRADDRPARPGRSRLTHPEGVSKGAGAACEDDACECGRTRSARRRRGEESVPAEAHPRRRSRRRRPRRRGEPVRLGHSRLVLEPLGHADRRSRSAYIVAGVALKTVQTSLTAYAWYSILRFAYPGPSPLARDPRVLRRVRRAERLPARQHRHAGDAADVHDDHRRRDLRRDPRRIRGPEDLLHADRRLRLPLSLPQRRRLVRHQVRVRARAPVGDGDLSCSAARFLLFLLLRRLWPRVVNWWEQAKDGGGILATRARTSSASSCRRSCAGSPASE